MSRHRFDKNINELKQYFNSVIDWVSSVFTDVESEMRGLEWGRLYEEYHKTAYSPKKVFEQVKELYGDPYIKNRKGIFEYILGGSQDTKLLEVRVFDDATKKSVYTKQTKEAESKGKSICPLCAIGHDSNKTEIWKLNEMDADHVTAWSKGGATDTKKIAKSYVKLITVLKVINSFPLTMAPPHFLYSGRCGGGIKKCRNRIGPPLAGNIHRIDARIYYNLSLIAP